MFPRTLLSHGDACGYRYHSTKNSIGIKIGRMQVLTATFPATNARLVSEYFCKQTLHVITKS